jgi:transposase
MSNFHLSEKAIKELEILHKNIRDKRIADRIKTIVALAKGYTYQQIEEILLIDERTAKRYKKEYYDNGIDKLLTLSYKGGIPKLTKNEEIELSDYIDNHIFHTAKEICDYVKEKYNIKFTPDGMVITLHRLGFSYKKTKKIPAKANIEEQKAFVLKYKEIKDNLKDTEKIYFMDGVHPTHNVLPSYVWIRKGKDKEIKSNTGRQRMNINGVYSPQDHEIIYREDDKINSLSTIELLKSIELRHPELSKIYIIRDNARYYTSDIISEYLKTSKIEFVPLPSYSPNLNLIERLWKLFKKKIIYDKYYEKFKQFKMAVFDFFDTCSCKYTSEMDTLLTENFQMFKTSGIT